VRVLVLVVVSISTTVLIPVTGYQSTSQGQTLYLSLIIINIIIVSYSLFKGFPGTFPLEPVVNPATQASSF
jgi:hypothetical protein